MTYDQFKLFITESNLNNLKHNLKLDDLKYIVSPMDDVRTAHFIAVLRSERRHVTFDAFETSLRAAFKMLKDAANFLHDEVLTKDRDVGLDIGAVSFKDSTASIAPIPYEPSKSDIFKSLFINLGSEWNVEISNDGDFIIDSNRGTFKLNKSKFIDFLISTEILEAYDRKD